MSADDGRTGVISAAHPEVGSALRVRKLEWNFRA